jgi:hypothetical protein
VISALGLFNFDSLYIERDIRALLEKCDFYEHWRMSVVPFLWQRRLDERMVNKLETKVATALRALGAGLEDIALRRCSYEEGLETSEKSLGWAAPSGKIVLRIAPTAIDRHYPDTYGPGVGIIS